MIPKTHKTLVLLFLLIIPVYSGLQAQQTAEKYYREIDYLLYLPDGYHDDPAQRWPMVVFLHGSGSAGHDINKVKLNGIPGLIEQGEKYPFIVISPQSEEQGWNITDLKNLLSNEAKKYRIDYDRIYLTGLSMGGGGTWDLATAYPEFFAAIIPICGNTSQEALENIFQLRHTPVWCFHGAEDEVIKPADSENIIKELREYNPGAKLTVYPGVGHDSWTRTYNDDTVLEWMLQQTRYKNRAIELDEALLKEYASFRYTIPNQTQTAHFTVEKGGLRLWVGGQPGEVIKPASKDTFFLDADSRKYLIFERNANGEISGLTLYEYNNKIFCKRVKD